MFLSVTRTQTDTQTQIQTRTHRHTPQHLSPSDHGTSLNLHFFFSFSFFFFLFLVMPVCLRLFHPWLQHSQLCGTDPLLGLCGCCDVPHRHSPAPLRPHRQRTGRATNTSLFLTIFSSSNRSSNSSNSRPHYGLFLPPSCPLCFVTLELQLFGNPMMKMVLDYKWQTYAENLFMRCDQTYSCADAQIPHLASLLSTHTHTHTHTHSLSLSLSLSACVGF